MVGGTVCAKNAWLRIVSAEVVFSYYYGQKDFFHWMLDTKPCGLWLLMTIVYLGEREEGIVRETEAFMGGYVNNVWSKGRKRQEE